MNTLITLTQHDKIGIYIGVPLVIILVIAIALWLLQRIVPTEEDMNKWENEMHDYFKNKYDDED